MRTGLISLVALLSLAVASPACKKKEDATSDTEKDEKASKKKKKGADDEEEEPKAKKKKGADDEEASEETPKKKKKTGDDEEEEPKAKKKKSAGGALTANIEGQEIAFKYGRTMGWGSLRVELSNEKLPCKGGAPSDDAYTMAFELPAGPGGTFFAGQDIGLLVSINHQRIKLKSTFVHPAFVKVNVDAFKLEGGEKLTGSLDFDHTWTENKDGTKKDWKYTASGKFDVEICDDSFGNYKKAKAGVAKDAPEGNLGGKFGTDAFTPKGALAIVGKEYGSNKLYIDRLEFYEAENVDCTNHWSEGRKATYFYLTDIGGGGEDNKLEGTVQPAKPWYAQPKGGKNTMPTLKSFGYSGGLRAWVKFDKVDYKKGSKLTGTLMADSGPDAKPDEIGKIGGTFEAKVCNTW